jgi:hypothetical protein
MLFFDHVCTITQPGPINKTNCFVPTTIWMSLLMKLLIKGTNIGSNNLHPSLDFSDGVLMPKLAKKSEFDAPANVGWTKM